MTRRGNAARRPWLGPLQGIRPGSWLLAGERWFRVRRESGIAVAPAGSLTRAELDAYLAFYAAAGQHELVAEIRRAWLRAAKC